MPGTPTYRLTQELWRYVKIVIHTVPDKIIRGVDVIWCHLPSQFDWFGPDKASGQRKPVRRRTTGTIGNRHFLQTQWWRVLTNQANTDGFTYSWISFCSCNGKNCTCQNSARTSGPVSWRYFHQYQKLNKIFIDDKFIRKSKKQGKLAFPFW